MKWTGLGHDEMRKVVRRLEACADREDLDARVVACAGPLPNQHEPSVGTSSDKASVKAVKRAVP